MENINPLSSESEVYATPNTASTRKALSLTDLNRQSVTKSRIPIKKLFQSYYNSINISRKIPTTITAKKSRSKRSESYTPDSCDSVSPEASIQSDINACIRISPPNSSLNTSLTPSSSFYHLDSNTIQIKDKIYNFDEIYPSKSTQREIFNSLIIPIAEKSIEGINVSIIAYGQTASGKTYTMFGNLIDHNKWGILPNLFNYYFNKNNEDKKYILKCSFIEIYNEKINDLLDPTTITPKSSFSLSTTTTNSTTQTINRKKYKEIRENGENELYIEDLVEYTVRSVDEGLNVLVRGLQNRKTGETKMNASSSRSHCIFKMKLYSKTTTTTTRKDKKEFEYDEEEYDENNYKLISIINCVDLAGSERHNQTNTEGERLKEANNINKSLSQLGLVILSLCRNNTDHISYRDSKLTLLLKESLSGNSKTVIIGTISGDVNNINETISTLNFVARSKGLKMKIKRNSCDTPNNCNNNCNSKELIELKNENERLKYELHLAKSNKIPSIVQNALKEVLSKDKLLLSENMRLLDEQKHNIEKVNEYKGIIKQLYHIISLKTQVIKEYSEDSVIDQEKLSDSLLLETKVNDLLTNEIYELKVKNKTVEELEDENENLRVYIDSLISLFTPLFGNEYGDEENEKQKEEFLSKIEIESLKNDLQRKIIENERMKENNEKVMKELMIIFDEYPDIKEMKKVKQEKEVKKNMKLIVNNDSKTLLAFNPESLPKMVIKTSFFNGLKMPLCYLNFKKDII